MKKISVLMHSGANLKLSRGSLIKIISNVTLFLLLLLGSSRTALFENGYTLYGSITGYSNLVMKSLNFPLSFNFLFGYFSSTTPIFQLFVVFSNLIVNDAVLAGKLDIVAIFLLYYIFSYILSNMLYTTFNNNRAPFYFNLLFITLMFVNYDFMLAYTDQMIPLIFAIPIFLYCILKSYRILAKLDNKFLDYVKLALALSFAGLGDPRFFIWGAIALLGLPVYSLATKKREGLKIYFLMILLSVPIVLFEYHSFAIGSGLVYVSPRPLTYSDVNYFTKAFPLLSYLNLGGLYWPGFTYSPYSILSLNATALNRLLILGSPTAEVLPYSALGYFWFITTSAFVIIFAISLLYVKGKESIYLLGLVILLTIYVGTYIPLVWLYIYLGKVPFVGGIWAITEAIPNYSTLIIYPIVLFYIGVMLSKIFSKNMVRVGRKGILPKLLMLFLLGLLISSNWQFFTGDFYPGQYSPVIPGNGISPMSPLAVAKMPGPVQNVYDLLSKSLSNGSFSVFWPQAYGFTYNWSKRVTGWYPPGPSPPGNFVSYFQSIISKNETWLTLPLMEVYGVRYIVVDNTSYSGISPLGPPITNNIEYSFLLASPGISLAYNFSPYIYVFGAQNASSFQTSPTTYSVKTNALTAEFYFSSIFNSEPILLNASSAYAVPLSVNSKTLNGSSLLTYNYFAERETGGQIPGTFFSYSPSNGIYNIMNNWYFTSMKGTGTFNSTSGGVVLNSNESNAVSLSYGDFLDPGHAAIPIPQGYGVSLNVSFQFLGSSSDSVSSEVWITNNESFSSGQGGWYLGGVTEPGNGGYRDVSYSTTIPSGALYFEVQINPTFKGQVIINDINITYSFYKVVQGYPAAFSLNVTRPGNYTVGILYIGNGMFTFGNSTFKLNSSSVKAFTFNSILQAGNLSIAYKGINIMGLMLLTASSGPNTNADVGFNLFQASINLKRYDGLLAVATPQWGWQVSNGRYLGLDVFGRQIFYDLGAAEISIKNGYLNNLAEIAFTAAIYGLLLYVFVFDRLRRPR
jgi:hypothetical protein